MVKVGDYLEVNVGTYVYLFTPGRLYEVQEVKINSNMPSCLVPNDNGHLVAIKLDSFGNISYNAQFVHIPAEKIKLLKDKILEVW